MRPKGRGCVLEGARRSTPHFLFSWKRKRAVDGPKEKRFWRTFGAQGSSALMSGGRIRRETDRFCWFVPHGGRLHQICRCHLCTVPAKTSYRQHTLAAAVWISKIFPAFSVGRDDPARRLSVRRGSGGYDPPLPNDDDAL